MQAEIASSRHLSGKRQRAGFTQTTTQTVKYFIKIHFVSLSINQDWTTQHKKENFTHAKDIFSKSNWRHFFYLYYLPFIINPFILSVFSVIKINKGSTRGTKIYTRNCLFGSRSFRGFFLPLGKDSSCN